MLVGTYSINRSWKTYSDLEKHLGSTSREPNRGDLLWVSPKGINILSRPLERMFHIPQSYIRSSALMQQTHTIRNPCETKPIIISNVYKIRAQIEEAFGGGSGLAAAREAASVGEYHDGKTFAGAVGGCPDVQVKAVFSRGAVDVRCCERAGVDDGLDRRPFGFGEAKRAGWNGRKTDILEFIEADGGITSNGFDTI